MNEETFLESFTNYLQEKGLSESSLSLDLFPQIFIEYFQEIKFEEVEEENDGDMILFQYGIYNWGKGRVFELNFTRQFCEVFPEVEAHQIFQLGVTFYYNSESFTELTSLTKWSNEFESMREFENVITHSDGFKSAIKTNPIKQETWITLV